MDLSSGGASPSLILELAWEEQTSGPSTAELGSKAKRAQLVRSSLQGGSSSQSARLQVGTGVRPSREAKGRPGSKWQAAVGAVQSLLLATQGWQHGGKRQLVG